MCADEHLAEFDEVAVLLVVNLNDTPGVATSADLAAIGASDLGSSSDNCERNLGQDLVVLGNRLVVIELVTRTLEDLDVVVLDIRKDLRKVSEVRVPNKQKVRNHTLALKAAISSSVKVSALAMTGMRLTLV